MSRRITIDPMTRLEGHLRIEVEVADGKVVNAWSSGQMFRGIEMILQGRDPRDAHHFVQRSCGVCTYVHSLSSVRAVEDAIGIEIPENAKLIRRLMHGAQFMHDHIVHFYHLHALDWVDVVSALKADLRKTAKLADNISPAPWGGTAYYKSVQDRLQTFVDSGQLGVFQNAYWGHSAYKLPPEANLIAASHYIEALRLQAKTARLHAIFGGKNPHPQSLVVGGVSSIADLTPDRIAEFQYIWRESQEFVENVYIPDLVAIASFYKDWGGIGGTTNYLAWGDFAQNGKEPDSYLMPRGFIKNQDLGNLHAVDTEKLAEHVARSWYDGRSARHPYDGETKPQPGDYEPVDGKYSWIKAPRYDGEASEVGPLSRVLIAYANGQPQVKQTVDGVLKQLDIPRTALFSTLGRTAARGIETMVIGQAMEGWLNELVANVKNGDKKVYQDYEMPDEAMGFGLNDVPRGALGHWIKIKNKKIGNYQYVVPSTWNFGPRCEATKLGPVEESLIGTPVADPKQPLEVLRTVHSFDPCIACAVHLIDPDSNEVYQVRAT
ncbi:MAG: nickel-dependent hydrogenase large subunit [Thermodesulfobacteriota bacterium]